MNVAKREEQPLQAGHANTVGIDEFMIEAVKAGNIDVVERMMALRDKHKADVARERFDTEMAQFQSICPRVIKKKSIDGKVLYAPLEDIEEICRPFWLAHGFSHTYDTDTSSKPGTVKVICHVSGWGHTRSTTVEMPMPDRTRLMNATQQHGSAISYGKRYALTCAYNIIVAGEDTDGAGKETKGPIPHDTKDPEWNKLRKELWAVMEPVRGTAMNWIVANQWLWQKEILDGGIPEEAPNLSVQKFKEVIAAVKKILK
jgi:hypothetical protein